MTLPPSKNSLALSLALSSGEVIRLGSESPSRKPSANLPAPPTADPLTPLAGRGGGVKRKSAARKSKPQRGGDNTALGIAQGTTNLKSPRPFSLLCPWRSFAAIPYSLVPITSGKPGKNTTPWLQPAAVDNRLGMGIPSSGYGWLKPHNPPAFPPRLAQGPARRLGRRRYGSFGKLRYALPAGGHVPLPRLAYASANLSAPPAADALR